MPHRIRIAARLAVLAGALAATPVLAERPMAVDDAGTLDKGGAKLEFGLTQDHKERGWEGAVGYAPIDNLELEINFARATDRDTDPHTRLRGHGFAAKWVPLKAEVGLSAGLKLEYGRVRINDRINPADTAHGRGLTGLASWSFASGQIMHFNVGREWLRACQQRPERGQQYLGRRFRPAPAGKPAADPGNLRCRA